MFYSPFLYGIIDWILEKIPVRNRGSQMGKSTYTNGSCSKRTCAYDGGGVGSNFCHFSACVREPSLCI